MATPLPVVKLLWHLINGRRATIPSVVDLGAGDGRFAKFGKYGRYTGYELDADKPADVQLPSNAAVISGCVLDVSDYFCAAVGNPPFIRNQDLGLLWRRRARSVIFKELSEEVDSFSNLYLYFLWLALARTTADGIVALVIPYDWTYRPSARTLREYIARQRWSVDVYRLLGSASHFPGVKTTASIAIIDKRGTDGRISMWAVQEDLRPSGIRSASKLGKGIFPYEAKRTTVYATRGFSPGSQEVFALTDQARAQAKIPMSSLLPCVTSLRELPRELSALNWPAFQKYFVEAGRPCWLLKTHPKRLAKSVRRWLEKAPAGVRMNTTCRLRKVWYRYSTPAPPRILLASGFRSGQPRILENRIGARNLGSVFGVFAPDSVSSCRALVGYLKEIDFERGTIPDARGFHRIEVRQVNGLLKTYSEAAAAK